MLKIHVSIFSSSREKSHLDDILDERLIELLVSHAGIHPDKKRRNMTEETKSGKIMTSCVLVVSNHPESAFTCNLVSTFFFLLQSN